jgi:hypothetical protein
MTDESQIKPSFSPRRKWGIGLDLAVRTMLVLVVFVVLNHLASRHFYRRYLSSQTRAEITPRTINVLKSFTNNVNVTVYYDKEDDFYSMITDLLKEFHNVNPRIRVTMVDPVRDPGLAIQLKKTYDLGTATNRNFIIFDCEGGGKKFVPGGLLVNYDMQRLPDTEDSKLNLRRTATHFRGEMVFAGALVAVTSPKPLNAYFLIGHGEHPISGDAETGYLNFAALLAQDYVRPDTLSLSGNRAVPSDCNLLIIAGPDKEIPESELEKINQYLKQGGRVLALFTGFSGNQPTGLERLLKEWGVTVGASDIRDPENSLLASQLDVLVRDFGGKPHTIMNPLVNYSLWLLLPRPVAADASRGSSDTLNVQEIAFSGGNAFQSRDAAKKPQRFSVAVAVERAPVPGVASERGNTRLVAVGDSHFLSNQMLGNAGNREFAHAAANWLLDRPHLLDGVGPRALDQYRITLTQSQMHKLQWILLAAMPGAILALGGLVWLRRRK